MHIVNELYHLMFTFDIRLHYWIAIHWLQRNWLYGPNSTTTPADEKTLTLHSASGPSFRPNQHIASPNIWTAHKTSKLWYAWWWSQYNCVWKQIKTLYFMFTLYLPAWKFCFHIIRWEPCCSSRASDSTYKCHSPHRYMGVECSLALVPLSEHQYMMVFLDFDIYI